MAASYPAAVKTFSAIVNGVTKLVAALFNSPYDEITALETELGTDPAGSVADVKTRLAVALNDDGTLKTVATNKGGTGVALMQRGRASLSNGGTVTFGTTFGDTNYTLIITKTGASAEIWAIDTKSATGFTFYTNGGGSYTVDWLAIDDV